MSRSPHGRMCTTQAACKLCKWRCIALALPGQRRGALAVRHRGNAAGHHLAVACRHG